MPNFPSVINSHNEKILNENIARPTSASFNCTVKTSSPIEGNCLQSSLIYICKARTPNVINNIHDYIDLPENTFKARYQSKKDATALSNFLWESKYEYWKTSPKWKYWIM